MPVAIPAIAVALLAVLAVLVLFGTDAFVKAVAGVIPKDVPIVGRLHNIVLAIGAVAEAALGWIMADLIGPAFAFITKPVLAIEQFIESVRDFGRTMATSWLWLLNSAIPSVISKLQRYAHDLVHAARAYALSLYHKVQKYAHDLVAAARAYALSLYHHAITYAHDLVHTARIYAHDLVHIEEVARVAAVATAKVYARDLVHAVEGDLNSVRKTLENEIKAITSVTIPDVAHAVAVGVQQAEDYANAAATAAVGVLTTDVTAAVAGLFDGLIIDVGALEDVIATDLPDIGAAIRAIPRALPTDLAGIAALDLAISIPMLRYMARCGVPNCRNLSSLGRELNDLLGALSGGALLGLMAALCTDPEGTAHFLHDEVGGIVTDAVDGAKSLLGL